MKGNYNYKDNAVPASESLGGTSLPNSLYLKDKPVWFGRAHLASLWPGHGVREATRSRRRCGSRRSRIGCAIKRSIDGLFQSPRVPDPSSVKHSYCASGLGER